VNFYEERVYFTVLDMASERIDMLAIKIENNAWHLWTDSIETLCVLSGEGGESKSSERTFIIINHSPVGKNIGDMWESYGATGFECLNENFSVYQIDGYQGSGIAVRSDYLDEKINISGFGDIYEHHGKDFIAISNNSDAQKRMLKPVDIKGHGKKLNDNTIQAIDVDLDGDGDDDLLRIVELYNSEDLLEKGLYRGYNNYSAFLYYENVDGEYEKFFIEGAEDYNIYEDFILESLNIDEETLVTDEMRFSIIGCIDINNNDALEVIVKKETISGVYYMIYVLAGYNKLSKVFEYHEGK
jgi:hypothetical protein